MLEGVSVGIHYYRHVAIATGVVLRIVLAGEGEEDCLGAGRGAGEGHVGWDRDGYYCYELVAGFLPQFLTKEDGRGTATLKTYLALTDMVIDTCKGNTKPLLLSQREILLVSSGI